MANFGYDISTVSVYGVMFSNALLSNTPPGYLKSVQTVLEHPGGVFEITNRFNRHKLEFSIFKIVIC